ncbi:uncharacterized protein LOC118182755 [Stegodyphus dumicola]|uniref:uncharacterized protein LOC118182755 n=1 Tax=Stegodyphus dumicola TaxID=202533 RepID=UPI0015AE04C5|nr:uncharacterized protein LOC118182755 [Stegodyphus dumicola]
MSFVVSALTTSAAATPPLRGIRSPVAENAATNNLSANAENLHVSGATEATNTENEILVDSTSSRAKAEYFRQLGLLDPEAAKAAANIPVSAAAKAIYLTLRPFGVAAVTDEDDNADYLGQQSFDVAAEGTGAWNADYLCQQ